MRLGAPGLVSVRKTTGLTTVSAQERAGSAPLRVRARPRSRDAARADAGGAEVRPRVGDEGGRRRPGVVLQALNVRVDISPEEADVRVEVPMIEGVEATDLATTARTWVSVFRADKIERVPVVVRASLPQPERRPRKQRE